MVDGRLTAVLERMSRPNVLIRSRATSRRVISPNRFCSQAPLRGQQNTLSGPAQPERTERMPSQKFARLLDCRASLAMTGRGRRKPYPVVARRACAAATQCFRATGTEKIPDRHSRPFLRPTHCRRSSPPVQEFSCEPFSAALHRANQIALIRATAAMAPPSVTVPR